MKENVFKEKRKILVACVPADGHFSPLTGIAKHLQQIGYDVRWYTSPHYAGKIKKLQIPFYPFKHARNLLAENLDKEFPQRVKMSTLKKLNFDFANFFIRRGPEYLQDLQEIYTDFPFDALLCDVCFTGATFVRHIMGIPVLSAGILPLCESSKDLAPYGLALLPAKNTLEKIKHAVLRWMANRMLFKPSNKVMHQLLDQHNITHQNPSFFDLVCRDADILMQSGCPSFEYHRSDLGSNVRFIGSLLPYEGPVKKDHWYDERVDQYSKIVLLTQGTVEKDISKLILPTLEAFKEDNDILLICTTGGSQTQLLREKYECRNIIIEDFIPFRDIMPYCNAYISNGGYGGVLLGIEHQLPMVLAGVHEGKNEICARVGYFNYGINLKTEKPTAAQVRSAVNEIFTNKIYQENIEKLGVELAGYDSNRLVEKYLAELPGKQKIRTVQQPSKPTAA